jgi:hypothetical protein
MFDFQYIFTLSLWQYICILIEILVIGFWLLMGEECYHVVCDAPLAGYGYDATFDNLFKCSLLFVFLISTICYYGYDNISLPLGVTLTTIIGVCGISFMCRSLFGWRS